MYNGRCIIARAGASCPQASDPTPEEAAATIAMLRRSLQQSPRRALAECQEIVRWDEQAWRRAEGINKPKEALASLAVQRYAAALESRKGDVPEPPVRPAIPATIEEQHLPTMTAPMSYAQAASRAANATPLATISTGPAPPAIRTITPDAVPDLLSRTCFFNVYNNQAKWSDNSLLCIAVAVDGTEIEE